MAISGTVRWIGTYNELPRHGGTQGLSNLVGILAHAGRAHAVDGIGDAALPPVVARPGREAIPTGSPAHPAVPPRGMPAVRARDAAIALCVTVLLGPALACGLGVGEDVPRVKVGELFDLAVGGGDAGLRRSPRVGAGRYRGRVRVRHRALQRWGTLVEIVVVVEVVALALALGSLRLVVFCWDGDGAMGPLGGIRGHARGGGDAGRVSE